jgi:hypothetical protein
MRCNVHGVSSIDDHALKGIGVEELRQKKEG